MTEGSAPDELLRFDREHVWHPYSSALTPGTPALVESASGVRLRLRLPSGERREVIDAMSSWWCAIHGYAVPDLDAAARDQLDRMSHVMFGGLTHEPAIALARELLDLAPRHTGSAPLEHVFFADSGSVSVEVAMKMALQCQLGRGRRRTRFFTIRGGYHGDTFSPMSVTDPVGGMHSLFTGILPEHIFAPQPPAGLDSDLGDWEVRTRSLYAEHADEVAAVILEPVLQGAGGMHVYNPAAVRVLCELARQHGALVIFDEIATGFGRTGTMWGADRVGVTPDILCVGKALTGGYLTLAAVLCTGEVARGVSSAAAGVLMHGPTFMANPLACSVARASLRLLGERDALAQVARLERGLAAGLEPARTLASVHDVRVLGGVGVIALREPVRGAEVTAAAIELGVWVRPFRDLVYTMPPYVTSPDDLATITSTMVEAVRAIHG
ncbi:MAG TPA: adenosylmethionine--8-amino-7-oxononanoate transaminase [Candidatus Lustribacter sp.]|nr:adenosylmethionine--8-amino-7-oxononanoate transaminase [Candidatus Lustribacter sp.]